ncbi:PadR family transcriptional regulator [Pseudoduganella sp.]|uniref:PadR family transcriptional regulator n=1 Tax=Pseudoduganella sp. TaxID=1880898 RepID=UPI0035AEA8BF
MFHFFRGRHRLHHEHHHHQRGGGRGPKMFDSGAMRYVVLQLIADKPRHGYEIIKELETLTGGSYSPSPGAIYPLLSMLADMGQVDIVKDGNKKLYSVLPEGLAFLDANRAMVDAYMARLSCSANGEAGGDLRSLMHALKEAVFSRGRGPGTTRAQVEAIRAILKNATDEINKLNQ